MTQKTKKHSAAKKLVPAAGMLAVSAMMLATSTYAWFTMAREAEVRNIQMTASVPENIQISLGQLTELKTGGNPTDAEISTGSTYVGLQGNQGILAGSADNGGVTAPLNNGSALDDLFWANTADISEYYRLGKIIPASSTTGADIYFTPDASGVGKTLKDDAKFYQVASLTSADFTTLYKWDDANKTFSTTGGGDPARTTLHAITAVDASTDLWNPAAAESENNKYRSAESWYETNDDGYYVDIPMWIRSSSKATTTLSVDAFVTTNAGKTNDGTAAADDELYMAARAAIIYASDASNAPTTVNTTSNLLSIRKDTFATTNSIINYMYSTNNEGDAVAGFNENHKVRYGNVTEYDGDDIITIPARNTNGTDRYGAMVKVVVRVWLEGEDPNCWNPNAGQDFNISLKFVKGKIKTGAEENASGYAYPTAWNPNAAENAHANANMNVDASSVVTIKETINGVENSELKFRFNGLTGDQAKWDMIQGSPEILNGKTYTISGNSNIGTVNGANGIAEWLKTNVKTKADAAVVYEITGAVPAPAGG